MLCYLCLTTHMVTGSRRDLTRQLFQLTCSDIYSIVLVVKLATCLMMMGLNFDPKPYASLQPPKPQAQRCSECLNIPNSIRNHGYRSCDFLGTETLDASGWRHWFRSSNYALKQSAMGGCPLCALIYPRCLHSFHEDPHHWKHGNGDARLEMVIDGPAPCRLDFRLGDWHVQDFDFIAAPHEWCERLVIALVSLRIPKSDGLISRKL